MAIQDGNGTSHPAADAVGSETDHARNALLISSSDAWDVYRGTAEDLVRAGLIEDDELPGRPGRPKTSCRYTADGQLTKTLALQPGGKHIRADGKRFLLYLALSEEARAARHSVPVREFADEAASPNVMTDERALQPLLLNAYKELLAKAKRDLALTDSELVRKHRTESRALIQQCESRIAALSQHMAPQQPALRLVHSAAWGQS